MAYQRWWKTVRDQQGNAINGANCAVYNGGTGTLATIYDPNTDDSAPGSLSNPFTTTANGVFGFMAADGEYDVQISGGNGATQQYRVTLTAEAGPNAVAKVTLQPVFTTPIELQSFTPYRSGTANFSIAYGGSSFSGIKDPAMFIGYNADRAAGLTGSATEPEFYQAFESNYWDGSNLMCEWYIHYQSADSTTVPTFRPIAMTVGRDDNASHWARIQTDIGDNVSNGFSAYRILSDTNLLWFYMRSQTQSFVPLYMYHSNVYNISDATANGGQIFGDDVTPSRYQFIVYKGDTSLYLWNMVNGRFLAKHVNGSTNLNSTVEYQASLKVDGSTTMVGGVQIQGKAFTANGATVTFTFPANTRYQYITTSAASLATTLPATSAALDGMVITFVAGSAVATATWVAGTGGATIVGAPASLVANTPVRFIYHHATTSWYPY